MEDQGGRREDNCHTTVMALAAPVEGRGVERPCPAPGSSLHTCGAAENNNAYHNIDSTQTLAGPRWERRSDRDRAQGPLDAPGSGRCVVHHGGGETREVLAVEVVCKTRKGGH